MRRLSRAGLAGLLLLGALGPQAAAQPAAPAGDGVTLAFKFVPGKVTRRQVKLTSDMKIGMGAQGEQPGQEFPGQLVVTLTLRQKVDAVSPAGEGTITAGVDSMDIQLSGLGQTWAASAAKGKVTATLNGQPIDPGALPFASLGIDPRNVTGGTFAFQIGPRGQISSVAGPAEGAVARVPGAQSAQQLMSGAISLPDRPVKLGESWENKTSVPISRAGEPPVQWQMNTVNTLKSVTTKGGSRIAVIETKGDTGFSGEGVPERFRQGQPFTTTSEFDLTSGEVRTAKLETDFSVDLASLMSSGGAPNPGTPGGANAAPGANEAVAGLPPLTMKGHLTINAGPAPAETAKPPAKKPATKKPAPRKAPTRR